MTEARLAPDPAGLNAEWYERLRLDGLSFQRCLGCGRWRHPPRYLCSGCGSAEWSWARAAGTGTLFTWTVTHQALHPGFEVPYAVGVAELDEGVRLVAGIRGATFADLALGLPVVVEGEVLTEAITLPVLRPRR